MKSVVLIKLWRLWCGMLLIMAFSAFSHAATISIACGSVGMELELCREGTKAWSEKTGHSVKLISTPTTSNELLALYQHILLVQSDQLDVLQIDVIWPGMLHNHFLDMTGHVQPEAYFPALIQNNTVNGRLVAIPWFTDAGVLYYRKDLLKKYGKQVPETWEALTRTAKHVQQAERSAGNNQLWGYVWQGRAYEGLTCDALEWIHSYRGGTFLNSDGKVDINNPQALKALTMARGWIGFISPEDVLKYMEEESRVIFQAGNAVFMRNWPYAWSLLQSKESPVREQVGVAALPKGGAAGQHSGTLGGWQLAVSKYSKAPELAIDLVKYLTSYEEQKRRAIKGSFNPTIKALYQDKDVLEAVPFFGSLYNTFANSVARPSTPIGEQYPAASKIIYRNIHAMLAGQQEIKPGLAELESRLEQLLNR